MQQATKITALANVLFWFNGMVYLLPGVVLIHIAKSFQVDTHIIGYIYTLLTVGNVTAVQCNGRLLDKVDIRIELLFATVLMLVSIIGISTVSSLPLFALCIFTFGLGNGFFSSTANYLIVNLYESNDRAARLNLLHFFFSVGAIMSPLISGALLEVGLSWQTIYRLALILLAGVSLIVWTTPVTLIKRPKNEAVHHHEKLKLSVYAIAISLFSYMIAEGSFVFWGNTYFIEYLGLDITKAGFLISVFWLFMAIGRGLSRFVLKQVSVEKYILTSSGLAFAALMILLTSSNYGTVLVVVGAMGLSFSGLYACILSYGTLQLPYPSAKLMSLYITFGSLGGLTSSPFSSWLKHSFSLKTSLIITGSFMAVVFVLIGATVLFLRKK